MNDMLIDLYKNNITLNITQLKEGCFFGVKIQLEQKENDIPIKRMYQLISLNDIQLIDEDVQSDTIIIDLIKDMIKEMVEDKR